MFSFSQNCEKKNILILGPRRKGKILLVHYLNEYQEYVLGRFDKKKFHVTIYFLLSQMRFKRALILDVMYYNITPMLSIFTNFK